MVSSCGTTPQETDDGLPAGEGVFLACSFWLADVFILQNRMADAEAMFRRLVGVAQRCRICSVKNTIRARKRLVGNFPQAFSHMALVNTRL